MDARDHDFMSQKEKEKKTGEGKMFFQKETAYSGGPKLMRSVIYAPTPIIVE